MKLRRKQSLTLGKLIQVIAEFANNDHEVGLAVADLMQRGVVRIRRCGRADHRLPLHQGIAIRDK